MPFFRGTRYGSVAGVSGIGAKVKYLLRATFNRADIALAAGDLEAQAPGSVQAGAVTLVVNDGTLAIENNKFKFTAQSTPLVGDQGLYSLAVTKSLGKALFAVANLTSSVFLFFGWLESANVNYSVGSHGFNIATGQISVRQDGLFIGINAGLLSTSTNYQFVVVLGGFDSLGLPYYAGQTKSNYTYGTWLFIKGGAFTNWTLIWTTRLDNTATVYGVMSNFDSSGTLDNFRVPDVDLSSVQVPVAFSSFTGSNGTSLDAITPEVGPAWVEANGDWDRQNNRANSTGTAPAQPLWTAYVASGISAFLARVVVNVVATRNGGHLIRRTDSDNQWWLLIDDNDTVKIYERNGGTITERASTSVTINASTDYDVVAIVHDTTITGLVNDGSRVPYGSATLNQTATQHGIRTNDAGVRFDNYTLYARSGVYGILDTV